MTNQAYITSKSAIMQLLSIIKKSSLYSNAFYLILNNVTTSLLGFIFWKIMANYFPPAEVGIGSALVSLSSLIAIISNLGLGSGIIRFVPEIGNKAVKLINTSFTLTTIMSLVISTFYLCGIEKWSPALLFLAQNNIYASLFVVFTATTALSVLSDQSLIVARGARLVFYKNTFNSLVKMPLPIIFLSFMGGYGIFIGTGIAFLCGLLLALFILLPAMYEEYLPIPRLNKNLLQKIIPYSFANYMGSIFNISPQLIYPLMVLNVLGPENSAFFYITWMMTMVMSVIPNAIAQSLLTESSHDPSRIKKDGRKVMILALIVSIPAVLIMIFVGEIFLSFFGESYAQNGTGLMIFLSLAIIPQCINSINLTVNQVRKKVYPIILQTGVMSFIALGGGYLFLNRFGLRGVGLAYTLAQSFVALVVFVPLWKILKKGVVDHMSDKKLNSV